MFDGSAVEKRSVNLGGRRRDNASASELARRARVERAARAAEAKRLRSAQTLQRWYRGRRAAKAWRALRQLRTRVQDLGGSARPRRSTCPWPPEAVAATLVAGFVAPDGAADATRLESRAVPGLASNHAAGLWRHQARRSAGGGENVGADVQSALSADDPTLLSSRARCCASVILNRIRARRRWERGPPCGRWPRLVALLAR